MRISDWSSDVCSSDLITKLDTHAYHPHRLCPHPLVSARAAPQHDPGHHARGVRAASERGAAVAGDRKSVVEGKSVSVRVDLGGRSIIKKKTIPDKRYIDQ